MFLFSHNVVKISWKSELLQEKGEKVSGFVVSIEVYRRFAFDSRGLFVTCPQTATTTKTTNGASMRVQTRNGFWPHEWAPIESLAYRMVSSISFDVFVVHHSVRKRENYLDRVVSQYNGQSIGSLQLIHPYIKPPIHQYSNIQRETSP